MVPLGRYLHAVQRNKEIRFPLHKQTGTERNSISGSNAYKPSRQTTLRTMNFTFQIQKIINRELSVFFLTIAKKNKTRIAYVSEDDRVSLSDVLLFDYIKCLPRGQYYLDCKERKKAANIF
jgi:hypothetical protein